MIPGWQKCRKHSFETLIFKYVHFDTMIDVTAKKREQRMLYFQYCERVSVQNSNWKENSRVIVNWAIFVQSEDHKRIIPPRMMNYAKIPYKRTIHLPRVSSTRSLLHCRSWTGRKKKRRERSCAGDVHTRTEGRQTFPLQWQGALCLDNDASEAEVIEEGESSNSLTTWAICKALKLSAMQKRILADKV